MIFSNHHFSYFNILESSCIIFLSSWRNNPTINDFMSRFVCFFHSPNIFPSCFYLVLWVLCSLQLKWTINAAERLIKPPVSEKNPDAAERFLRNFSCEVWISRHVIFCRDVSLPLGCRRILFVFSNAWRKLEPYGEMEYIVKWESTFKWSTLGCPFREAKWRRFRNERLFVSFLTWYTYSENWVRNISGMKNV